MATLSPLEIEFLSELMDIVIIPSFTMDTLDFISGRYGPFKPNKQVQVPFWLGVTLKKRKKCTILPPPHLVLENLKQMVEDERREKAFSKVPPHYIEHSLILLECASDDIPNSNQIRVLLEDLRSIRKSKTRLGLTVFTQRPSAISMNNLTLMELNEIRPFFLRAFDEQYLMTQGETETPETQPRTTTTQSQPVRQR